MEALVRWFVVQDFMKVFEFLASINTETLSVFQGTVNMIWLVAFLSCIGNSNTYKSFFFSATISDLNAVQILKMLSTLSHGAT